MNDEPGAERAFGPWQARVRFAPGGGFAFRPGEVLVRAESADTAEEVLRRLFGEEGADVEREDLGGEWVRFRGVPAPIDAIAVLHRSGVAAQVNHVLFATCCCPPHPADPNAAPIYANPIFANPIYANPIYANPIYANPIYANAGIRGGCCCGCGSGGLWGANPIYANPIYANPIYANPIYANADPNPAAAPWVQATGRRRSSARPADPPEAKLPKPGKPVRVAILDTGYAEVNEPTGLPGIHFVPHGGDRPDEDGDQYLDPAAGHGTFIAGVIDQLTRGCELEVFEVLTTYGDGDEKVIAETLFDLAARPDDERPHFVNLSFGGYSPLGMAHLADAIAALQNKGTVVVASAGNDGTCLPMYPAVLPGVVGVAALDEDGNAAPFTNYGPWVRACTLGVDIVSIFFEGWNGSEPVVDGRDEDDFLGWAKWSGTSFAAPRVVAALARLVQKGKTPQEAVEELVDDEQLPRKPMLGTPVLLP